MIFRRKKSLIIRLLTWLLVSGYWLSFFGRAAATPLEDIPLDSWVYPALEELYSRGYSYEFFLSDKPYSRGEVARCLKKISASNPHLLENDFLILRLRYEFADELAALENPPETDKPLEARGGAFVRGNGITSGKARPIQRGAVGVFLGLEAEDKFVTRARMTLDTRTQDDPAIRGRRWHNSVTLFFDDAYAKVHTRYLDLFWGRQHLQWGVGSDALLLSNHFPPLEQVKLKANYKTLRYQFLASRLDPIFIDTLGGNVPRFFSAHRLSWKPWPWLEAGVSESIVYGGPGRSFELFYLNPLLPFYAEQYNNFVDDNPFVGVDFLFSRIQHLVFFGELMIDDFQIDFKSEPQQIGFRLGGWISDFISKGRTFGQLEYTRVNTFVYGQNKPWNIYTRFGAGMGSEIGPDADRWRGSFLWRAHRWVDLVLSGEYRRRGENRITTPQNVAVPYEKFPSGVVEKTALASFTGRLQYQANVFADLTCGGTFLRNGDNRRGNNRDDFFVRGTFTITFWKTKQY